MIILSNCDGVCVWYAFDKFQKRKKFISYTRFTQKYNVKLLIIILYKRSLRTTTTKTIYTDTHRGHGLRWCNITHTTKYRNVPCVRSGRVYILLLYYIRQEIARDGEPTTVRPKSSIIIRAHTKRKKEKRKLVSSFRFTVVLARVHVYNMNNIITSTRIRAVLIVESNSRGVEEEEKKRKPFFDHFVGTRWTASIPRYTQPQLNAYTRIL